MPTVERVRGRGLVRGVGRYEAGDRVDVPEDEAAYLVEENGDFVYVAEEDADTTDETADTDTEQTDPDSQAETGSSAASSSDTTSGSDEDADADAATDGGTCEAVKADGEVCGRDLPCRYHSDEED